MPWASKDKDRAVYTMIWSARPILGLDGNYSGRSCGQGQALHYGLSTQLDLAPGECVEVRLVRVDTSRKPLSPHHCDECGFGMGPGWRYNGGFQPVNCPVCHRSRAEEPRRTPSTGLPPTCEGAAAMRIDPPGSVAAPHEVVETPPGADPEMPCGGRLWVRTDDFLPQDRPIPAVRLARIVMSVAETVTLQDDVSLADALSLLAERIAHPLRLGEHG